MTTISVSLAMIKHMGPKLRQLTDQVTRAKKEAENLEAASIKAKRKAQDLEAESMKAKRKATDLADDSRRAKRKAYEMQLMLSTDPNVQSYVNSYKKHMKIIRLHSNKSESKATITRNRAFECPITQERMQDPVTASDGYTYERSAIENWLRCKKSSPMTREELTSVLLPNRALKDAMDASE